MKYRYLVLTLRCLNVRYKIFTSITVHYVCITLYTFTTTWILFYQALAPHERKTFYPSLYIISTMLSGRNFSICQHEINIFGLNPNPKCYLSGMLDNIWLSSLLLVTFILQSRYCVLTSEYRMHAEHMVNVGEFYFYQTSAETTKYIFNDGAGATKDTCIVSVCVLP